MPVEPPLRSPTIVSGRANALTGGIGFTALGEAEERPPADLGEPDAPPS